MPLDENYTESNYTESNYTEELNRPIPKKINLKRLYIESKESFLGIEKINISFEIGLDFPDNYCSMEILYKYYNIDKNIRKESIQTIEETKYFTLEHIVKKIFIKEYL